MPAKVWGALRFHVSAAVQLRAPLMGLLLICASSSPEPAPSPPHCREWSPPVMADPPTRETSPLPSLPRHPQKSAPLVRLRQNVLGPFRIQADSLSATTPGVTLDMSGPLGLSFPT